MNTIILSHPIRTERVRGFQPPWRTVYVYRCASCKGETRVRASAFRGRHSEPGVGAIACPHCNTEPTKVLPKNPTA